MNNQRPDFAYEISDERLIAYSQMPLLDRLKWLDEIRQFTLLVRNAPTHVREDAQALVQRARDRSGRDEAQALKIANQEVKAERK